jgi:L-lactate permease
VSLIIPAWLVVTMSGWRGLAGVWPAVVVCGGVFAVVQFWWSNYVGPELVDIVGGLSSLAALALFCRVWKPQQIWEFPSEQGRSASPQRLGDLTPETEENGAVAVEAAPSTGATVLRAWMPWVFLSVIVIIWGLPPMKALMNGGMPGYRAFQAGRAHLGRAAAASQRVP